MPPRLGLREPITGPDADLRMPDVPPPPPPLLPLRFCFCFCLRRASSFKISRARSKVEYTLKQLAQILTLR